MFLKVLAVIFVFINPLSFFPGQSDVSLFSSQDKPTEIKVVWGDYSKYLMSAFWLTNPNYLPIRNWEVKEPEIQAKSALIFDLNRDQILYQKNSDDILPIASLTKLMTSLVVLENMDLDQIVVISEEALAGYGDQAGLLINEKISVRNLLYAMLMESSNDAALALAMNYNGKELSFVNLMNEQAQQLGLNNTSFADPSGFYPENVSTAREMVRLVRYSFKYPLIWEIMKTLDIDLSSADGKIRHHWVNTDELLNRLPNIIGGKTGYTEEAQGCLILVVKEPGAEYIITVVLGASQRFLETEKLINWVKKAYSW